MRDKLSKKITKYFEKKEDDLRDYIWSSSIGSDCLRQIWYQFKGIKGEEIPVKFKKTWEIGKRLEFLVREWLRLAGFNVETNIFPYSAEDMAYFKGHFDGIIIDGNVRAILEIKTAKDSSYKLFVKHGLKKWSEQYYAQVQSYMGMSGIHSTYIIVLNKDSSDHSDELVEFDSTYYERLKEKAKFVYEAKVEPPRINGSPLWFQCKMCKYNKVCHK